MKFRIHHWLIGCIPLGLAFGLLQRPLRDADFLRGVAKPWRWLLWLFYLEHLADDQVVWIVEAPHFLPFRSVNSVEAAGQVVGLFLYVAIGLAIVVTLIFVFDPPPNSSATGEEEQADDEEDDQAEIDNPRPTIHTL